MKVFRAYFNDNSELVLMVENKSEAQIMAENEAQAKAKKLLVVKQQTEKNTGHYYFMHKR